MPNTTKKNGEGPPCYVVILLPPTHTGEPLQQNPGQEPCSPYLATPHHTDTKTHRVDHAGEAGAVHISPFRLAAAAQAYTPTLRFPRCMVASKVAVSSLCAWLVVTGTVAR